jgi:hypothetical protein
LLQIAAKGDTIIKSSFKRTVRRDEWEGVMQRVFLKIFAIAVLMSPVLMNRAAYGQSLGEVARENRERQAAEDASGVHPKVITNKDLPADPEGNEGSREAQPGVEVAGSSEAVQNRPAERHFAEQPFAAPRSGEPRSAESGMGEQRAAEQWKRQILVRESRMANLQERIDRLNASIRSRGGSAQYEGPNNRYQARQLERVEEMQQRLDEQKRKLDEMQEAARRAGMHTAVYDP